MSWHGIEGHDAVVDCFRRSLARGRLASTYLFVGPPGVGKRSFALELARGLLCPYAAEGGLEACGACESCRLMGAGTHPDLLQVAKPPDKSSIPVATFIGEGDHRMQTGLCHDISLKPFLGGRRVAVIDDADDLNEDSANCLLKTLEEPPPKSVLILIGTSAARQLPTIRSRCQIVRFGSLPLEVIVRLLLREQLVTDPVEAGQLAALAEGSLSQAAALADAELPAFRRALVNHLATKDFDTVRVTEAVVAAVERAGTEASVRRRRLRQIVALALEFYRQLARALAGAAVAGDQVLLDGVAKAVGWWPSDAERATAAMERCLDALEHVDSNAHLTNVAAAWLDELGMIQGCLHGS